MLSSLTVPQSIWQAATVNFSLAIATVPPTGASGGEPEALILAPKFNFLEVAGADDAAAVVEEKKADEVVVLAASDSSTGLILLAAATNIRHLRNSSTWWR